MPPVYNTGVTGDKIKRKENAKMKRVKFSNATMFSLAMQKKEIGIPLLSRLLERKVKDMEFIDAIDLSVEKSIIAAIESRSVRLDVLFEDDDEWYNVEMQIRNEGNIPMRIRYIHSMLDVSHLEKGEDFNSLKKSFVIVICCFDPIGKELPKYFYETLERENGWTLGDERYTILINTRAKNAPDHFRWLFDYINSGTVNPDDSLVKDIDSFVSNMNDKGVGDAIMTAQDIIDRAKAAEAKALKQAEEANRKAEEANRKAEEANRKAEEADLKTEEARKRVSEAEEKMLSLVREGLVSAEIMSKKLGISVDELIQKL